MKFYRSLVEAVIEALTDIFQQDKYADKIIEKCLRSNPKWGSRDRAFIAETTYECVRWIRQLAAIIGRETDDFKSFSRGDFFHIVGAYWVLKLQQNVDFQEFTHINYHTLKNKQQTLSDRKIIQSIPNWLDEQGISELGEALWNAELTALNRPADIVLRCNSLKTTLLHIQKKLNDSGFDCETIPLSNSALKLKKRANIFASDLFKQGFFEVQDAGSQTIAPFLNVEPRMRVIDACAGAGGKSLHLATLMENKGQIIAMDTEAWKLEELKKRARRNGIHIIETRQIDSTKVIKRLHNSADRLLLDVPCSGIGVLRRNPDAKWKLKPEFLHNIHATQQQILSDYAKMLKIGGQLVYATCSIFPSENTEQVAHFIKNNPHFKTLDEQTISPATHGFDGFYMARLEKLF